MKRCFYLFNYVLLILCFSCNSTEKYRPVVNNGYLDLSGWDFDKDGMINLNGTWEFYWNNLYTPHDFEKDTLGFKPDFLNVPGVWNSKNLPGNGFGTYRLKIKLNHDYDILGIKLLDFSSSYNLWINHELVATNGKISSVLSEVKPQMHPQIKIFKVDSNKMEIVVQVANSFHHKGGMWESIRIGTQEQIVSASGKNLILAMFFAGTVFILFIYHLWIYLLRRNEKAALWFGILCFIVLIRTLQINERITYYFFPDFDLGIGYRIEYITMFCLIPLSFVLYFFYLYYSN